MKFDKIIQVSERSDTANDAQFRLGFKYYASAVGLVADKQTDFGTFNKMVNLLATS